MWTKACGRTCEEDLMFSYIEASTHTHMVSSLNNLTDEEIEKDTFANIGTEKRKK